MPRKSFLALFITAFVALLPCAAGAQPFKLAEGLAGASGSTVGPDGALYVTEGLAGRISRVDPWTGEKTEYATGLPLGNQLIPGSGLGGPVDVAFVDGVAYALVNLVGGCLGIPGLADNEGIYRMEGPDDFALFADLGAWSRDNPPSFQFDYFLDCGVPYAMDPFRGGFLVTDGHHNRVLWVSPDGEISEFKGFDNIVPTGLEVHGKTVYMAQAGETPHEPEDGSAVVAIDAQSGSVQHVGSGAPLLVDVEFGPGRTLYALAQGEWNGFFGTDPGTPADPGTGSLSRINADGSFTEVVGELNLPTSMQFIGNTAFIINLAGEIWVIEDVSEPPFGVSP
jgi:hypothetical protein